jgi:uncharacterized membrane protein YhaH (DUF805 family)
MLIAQLTDIHLGFEPDNPGEMNRQRLDQAVAKLSTLSPRPDFLICTGDLTDRGDRASYERLREALSPLPFPYYLVVGNHDLRQPLRDVFPEVKTDNGFIQYEIDAGPLRVLVLDTLEENRHAGAFGPDRAQWLDARLREKPGRPTLLVLHHPPVYTGIDWMTLAPNETWAPALTAVVSRHRNVAGAIAGHVHRPIVAPWAGTVLRVCPSCAPQVTLELGPMDLEQPDGRPLIQEEPPAFALHLWTGTSLVTHYGRVEDPTTLLRFDKGFQPVLKHFEEERGQEPAYPGETGVGAGHWLRRRLSFSGRLDMAGFWGTLITAAGAVGAAALAHRQFGQPPGWPPAELAIAALAIWPLAAAFVQRTHDRDRRARWLIGCMLSIVGFAWVLIELGFQPSATGAIRFGRSAGRRRA